MRWWRHGDCGLDGLWVLVDLGGHGMGCGLVFMWPNRCWYGDWMAGLVVLVFGGHGMGCGLLVVNQWFQQLVVSAIGICWWFLQSVLCLVWCLLVIDGFFFFFFPLFCWWFLPWWGVCDGGVVVSALLGCMVVVVVATLLGMCGCG